MTEIRRHTRIVVGVDGSAPSIEALRWAADEAVLRGSELWIAHGWTQPSPAWAEPAAPALVTAPDTNRRIAEQVVRDAALRVETWLRSAAPPVVEVVPEGPVVPALLDLAGDAELLVVGRRGAGDQGAHLLGSVAGSVIHRSPVPTALVSDRRADEDGELLVGVDDSPGAHAAFRWAAAEARRRGARLVVIHAWDTAPITPPGGPVFEPLPPTAHQERTDELIDRLVAQEQSNAGPGPTVERRAVEDFAAPALVRASVGASLLVVGSRGRGPIRSALLGSVSRRCAHDARCPTVIVPLPDPVDPVDPGDPGDEAPPPTP
jgi:nucleotide-binding universal stress UspA family protein